jgi:phospholipid/cholesterol/gamma-HCH transport system permease protein
MARASRPARDFLTPVVDIPRDLLRPAIDQLVWFGRLMLFIIQAIVAIPLVVRRFRGEVYRILAEVTVGGGALLVLGSSVGVIFAMSGAVGFEVGIQGFQGLHIIGLAPLSGYLSAYANTREIAPLIAAVAMASQLGCKYTAQLGAMRINDEIDALDVLGIPPQPYLVTTRMLAAAIAVIPLYLVGLFAAYFGTQVTMTIFFHQSIGTYQHYFHAFLQPSDVLFSVLKVVVFAVVVIPLHCYYGFYASGGAEGVGRAAGRAIRASSVCIALLDMLMTVFFWGLSQSVGLSA